MNSLLKDNSPEKVQKVLQLFSDCKVADWANELKEQYFKKAMSSLEAINVLSNRKTELEKLARFLLDREV